jgi:hypothetical protein
MTLTKMSIFHKLIYLIIRFSLTPKLYLPKIITKVSDKKFLRQGESHILVSFFQLIFLTRFVAHVLSLKSYKWI